MGQTDQALAAYFRALEFDANNGEVILRIAAIQLARDQPDQALSRLDQVVELVPNDGEARELRGLAHWKLHHLPEAIADFRAPPPSDCRAGPTSSTIWRWPSRPITRSPTPSAPPSRPSAWHPPTPPSADSRSG